ncbi:cell wall hydrolase [Cohnella sp. REN36]|uniref:cell wall hydrolase n=1 Tax=Cohnella sp. REN36 TaxID=2887347 RepID=UPI001D1358E8|nr:cell wall hydrolase [Cohnella sp. REN36]MCC3374519.1 cell wall hydrolase [Cohnella sp. REN36]
MLRTAALTLGLLLMVGTGAAFASADHAVYMQGQKVDLKQELWTEDGWTYAPVKEIADAMGWQTAYDADADQIAVTNGIDDTLSFRNGASDLTFNGQIYKFGGTVKLKDGIAYFPLRLLAEAMHASVGWQEQEKIAILQTEEKYAVADGDTLASIAEAHETSVEALMKRNGLAEETLVPGQLLKVVVPEFLEPEFAARIASAEAKEKAETAMDAADLELLAKLVQVEAGNEPYEGKLAVANVVLNRLERGYSDSIRGVIYAPGQFPPAKSGLLAKQKPSKESIKAAKAAFSGVNNVPGAVSFFNPKLEPGKAKKANIVKTIGHHAFSK